MEWLPFLHLGVRTVKGRLLFHNPFKEPVIKLIRSTMLDDARIQRAFQSLKEQDRDCMPYVTRLMSIERR